MIHFYGKNIDTIVLQVNAINYEFNNYRYFVDNIYNKFVHLKQCYTDNPNGCISHTIGLGYFRGEIHSMQVTIIQGKIWYSLIKNYPNGETAGYYSTDLLKEEDLDNLISKMTEFIKDITEDIEEID